MTILQKGIFISISLFIGFIVIYSILKSISNPSKKFKIIVQTAYTSGINIYTNSMDADSVRKDTIWNDGQYIINKNIVNILFK
jgi:homoserine acetyltransferase